MNFTFENDGIPFTNIKLHDFFSKEISKIQKIVEKKFGSIDKSYSNIINFNSNNAILTEVIENLKLIKIHLPIYEMNTNTENTIYQIKLNLSHEIVHTITPNCDSSKITYLEEGLATEFSEGYTGNSKPPDNRYVIARDLVLELFNVNSKIIKNIRFKFPNIKICDYTCQMFKEIDSNIDDDLLNKLTKKFNK